jgi:hypothetical protein
VPLSAARFRDELLGVASLLGSTRVGSVVITYHGLGGPIPSSYDLVCEDLVGTATLRTWVKTRLYEADWYHLDRVDDVPRVPRAELARTFAEGGVFE